MTVNNCDKPYFSTFTHQDYTAVCEFLVELNRSEKTHVNWNWARWEWMYVHPYTDKSLLNTIGLWKSEGKVVGAAIFDMYYGEAFCAALDSHRCLLPEIYDYAYTHLKDDGGLGVAVNDADCGTRELLRNLGYSRAEQTENILSINLDRDLGYELPDGFSVCEVNFPEDEPKYKTVIWKGFDHEDDPGELERMIENKAKIPPHINPYLSISIADEMGEYAAHCTCWYDEKTDYAYVEPVCTIPKYRRKGIGKAVVLEALNRCKGLGAKAAFVISDQKFYYDLGFTDHSHYTFYWKR